MNKNDNFKICPNCDFVWKNRKDFLSDNKTSITGYQVNFENLTAGLFLFRHSCKGSFSLKVSSFENLYTGPIFKEKATDTDDCPGYCLHKNELDPCPANCECAFVRKIIQILRR
jgi:hypothetical protein